MDCLAHLLHRFDNCQLCDHCRDRIQDVLLHTRQSWLKGNVKRASGQNKQTVYKEFTCSGNCLHFVINLPSFIKGAIPLIEIVGWLLCMYTCLLGRLLIDPKGGLNVFSLVAFPIQNWISVLNPLVTLVLIHAYRKAFINLLRHPAKSPSNSSAIAPTCTIKLESNLRKIETGSYKIWSQTLGFSDLDLVSGFVHVN